MTSSGDTEQATCDNPMCDEVLSCVPRDSEDGYCSFECAGLVRSGVAARWTQTDVEEADR